MGGEGGAVLYSAKLYCIKSVTESINRFVFSLQHSALNSCLSSTPTWDNPTEAPINAFLLSYGDYASMWLIIFRSNFTDLKEIHLGRNKCFSLGIFSISNKIIDTKN